MKQGKMYCGWTLLGKTNKSTMKAWDSPSRPIPSIEKSPVLEEKQLQSNLRYAYLGESSTLPVIISSYLSQVEKEKLLRVLRDHKEEIRWSLADIKGIRPSMCMHQILL